MDDVVQVNFRDMRRTLNKTCEHVTPECSFVSTLREMGTISSQIFVEFYSLRNNRYILTHPSINRKEIPTTMELSKSTIKKNDFNFNIIKWLAANSLVTTLFRAFEAESIDKVTDWRGSCQF